MNAGRPIGVAGAGSIGCFVGGMLAAGGRHVALLARAARDRRDRANGLRLTGFEGPDAASRRTGWRCPTMLPFLLMPAWCWSPSRAPIPPRSPTSLRGMRRPDAIVVSLQNGVGNVAVLRERLPGWRVLAGMVPFNVIAPGDGRFHRATSGDIVIEQNEAGHRGAFGAGLCRCAPATTSSACNGASCWSTSTTRSTRWPICRCGGNWRNAPGAIVCRPDGGRACWPWRRRHQAGLADAGPARPDATSAADARRDASKRCWAGP